MSPPLQAVGAIVCGGLLAMVGVLVYRMHGSKRRDASTLFLWDLMEGWPEQAGEDISSDPPAGR